MVAVLVVSHSRALARAAVALAREMAPDPALHLGIAAGLDEDTLGTDAAAVAEALTAADAAAAGAGVVVLMDLGSAVLAAELALDLLDDDGLRARVELCPAPLVEGLVAAAVTASAGAPRARVVAEALAGLGGKQAHLPQAPAAPPADAARPAPPDAAGEVRAEFTVRGEHGLHARPAALLVRRLHGFDATLELRNLTTGAGPAAADSLLGVATLAASAGHRIAVSASGPQARPAVDALLALAEQGFDDVAPGAVSG